MHINDDDGRGGGDDGDGGVDEPGESVVLPLPLLRPNRTRTILKDLKNHNQHCPRYIISIKIPEFSDLADAVLLDVLCEKEVD